MFHRREPLPFAPGRGRIHRHLEEAHRTWTRCPASSPSTCCRGRPRRSSRSSPATTRFGNPAAAFEAWTRSKAFPKAHAGAGSSHDIYLGPPQFEGFEAVL